MTRQLLRLGNVRASVKQVANEAATKIMRRKERNAGLGCTFTQDVEDSLIRQSADCNLATFINAAKE